MAVKTRNMRRVSAAKKRTYRKRVKSSSCRRAGRNNCTRTRSLSKRCKLARGRKRTYCRKKRNGRIHK